MDGGLGRPVHVDELRAVGRRGGRTMALKPNPSQRFTAKNNPPSPTGGCDNGFLRLDELSKGRRRWGGLRTVTCSRQKSSRNPWESTLLQGYDMDEPPAMNESAK